MPAGVADDEDAPIVISPTLVLFILLLLAFKTGLCHAVYRRATGTGEGAGEGGEGGESEPKAKEKAL